MSLLSEILLCLEAAQSIRFFLTFKLIYSFQTLPSHLLICILICNSSHSAPRHKRPFELALFSQWITAIVETERTAISMIPDTIVTLQLIFNSTFLELSITKQYLRFFHICFVGFTFREKSFRKISQILGLLTEI